jgi:hypothetical protein
MAGQILSDNRTETGRAAGIGAIAEELIALASALRSQAERQSWSDDDDQAAESPVVKTSDSGISRSDAPLRALGDLARKAYADRRRRDRIIGQSELFGEPAWDILLDLFAAHVEGKDVSVSSACIGSASPPTTGLRWLGVLHEAGLVMREHDPRDQRRILVRLTEQGLIRMSEYFRSILA